MRLSRFWFGFAALCASSLLLSHRCAAADSEAESSSAGSLRRPPLAPLRADRYINALNYDRIRRLPSSFSNFDHASNPKTPFFGRSPLYSIKAPVQAVEQAIRDHGSVGIVDAARQQAMHITIEEDHLEQQPFPDMRLVTGIYLLDGKIHYARKAYFGQIPHHVVPTSVDGLPHAYGMPILLGNGQDTVEHMLAASSQDHKAFWFAFEPRKYVRIDLHRDTLYTTLSDRILAEVNRAVSTYIANVVSYGEATASVISGRPLHNLSGMRHAPIGRIALGETPRFAAASATRQELLHALNMYGRFHLYVRGVAAPDQVYKVKLVAEETRAGRVLRAVVKPLGRIKRMQEAFLQQAGVIRIPV